MLNASENTIASLNAEMARLAHENGALAAVEAEAESLRQRAGELDRQVSSLNNALVDTQARLDETEAKLAEADARAASEKERRQEAELLLTRQGFELDQEKWKASEYQAQLASAKSALIQREEEVAQVWRQVLEAEKSAAIANTTVTQETARREASEQALADLRDQLETARAQHSHALEKLSGEVAMTTRLLRDENAASTAAQKALAAAEAELATRNDDLVKALDKLRSVEAKVSQAERKQADSTREIAALADKLQRSEREAETANNARVAAERKLASRFDEIARLTNLLSDETSVASASRADAEWMREIAKVSRSFPKWWALMPARWRRAKEHARYARRGLFDADQYISNNPDVAQENIDPLLHYIVHGSLEGRTWR